MRIIAGKYKKRTLQSVPGNTARPTMDFLKETIFNIIPDCEGKDFLDLYAGSGSIGLEAISRGASRAVFVEFAHNCIVTIIHNIDTLDCRDQCKLVRKKVLPFIRKCEDKFDLIFLDPPYDKKLVNSTIAEIIQNDLLREGGFIVIEHSIREKLAPEWDVYIHKIKKTRQSQVSILTVNK
ncbi:MAG: 16S rRNA (guanine(966)-N(2))-methyltransferase RsmD [Candidatus Cloacimonetes bacterium]|nr:16S rRNA (guanine(966)-N(2))-methyltransferase RsmD [Candidatus Cloacimonadota bacterium]